MNRKSFIRAMLPAFAACLLAVIAGGRADSQVEESLSLNFSGGPDWRTVKLEIPIKASARENFLATPVNTLRSQGVHVPEAAEAPWREFTQALRRLTNGPPARRANSASSAGRETLTFKITLTESGLTIYLGNGETNVADTRTAQRFLADPIRTLRSQGVQVATADERDWKQLADSLKALGLAYAKPRTRMPTLAGEETYQSHRVNSGKGNKYANQP